MLLLRKNEEKQLQFFKPKWMQLDKKIERTSNGLVKKNTMGSKN